MDKFFYDTCGLLELLDKAFEQPFVISSKTLEEIENIKTSVRKDEQIKFQARKLARLLDTNSDKYEVIVVTKFHEKVLEDFELPITPDNLILACCYIYKTSHSSVVFVSGDINCKILGSKIFNLDVRGINDGEGVEQYKGYKEVVLGETDMAYLYSHINENNFDCLINEYLIIKNEIGEITDKLKWNGEIFENLSTKNFKSRTLGVIKPLDYIQQCAFDTIQTNDITVLYGRAGSGKTTLPLSYIMQNLETQKFNKCHIIYHYEPLKGARTLGFEKGNHTEKILNSGSLGNILTSKFGDMQAITGMLANGTLNIIPTANIRGVEFGKEDVVFVTEAQNLNTYTLKTIIQRCKDGCKQIFEGDILEQADINCGQLGIDRLIEVFKGHQKFGVVKLKNNYRSELCELADKL